MGYYVKGRANERDGLDVPSLIVVYGFALWQKREPRRLDRAQISADIIERHSVRKGKYPLAQLHRKVSEVPGTLR